MTTERAAAIIEVLVPIVVTYTFHEPMQNIFDRARETLRAIQRAHTPAGGAISVLDGQTVDWRTFAGDALGIRRQVRVGAQR